VLRREGGGRDRLAPEHGSLDQVGVQVPVLVVVEQRRALAHHLDEVQLTRHAVEVDEVEAALRCPVDEDLLGPRRRRGQEDDGEDQGRGQRDGGEDERGAEGATGADTTGRRNGHTHESIVAKGAAR